MDSSNFCLLWRKTSHFHANSDVPQCPWICVSLYENIKIWLLARYLIFWPLPIICPTWVHPRGRYIEEGWAEHRYKGGLLFFLSVSLRTAAAAAAAVTEAIASTCRMQLESDETLSLFVVRLFHPPPRVPRATGWLTDTKAAPLINIWAARSCLSSPFMSPRSPVPLAGTNARTCRCCLRPAYWGDPQLPARTSLDPL